MYIAVPTGKGFPFFRVDNRKLGVLYLVFYVLQDEQEADVQEAGTKEDSKKKN